jgi:peptidyl-dipeptidase Dcp
MTSDAADNPLLSTWTAPFELPPFGAVAPEHFGPAFDRAIADKRAEIRAIADDPAQPSFANTIEALERSGATMDRVGGVFFNLSSAHTSDAIEAIEREVAPVLARLSSEIHLDPALFARIDALWQRRDAHGLDGEQMRVLERYHKRFVRAGAGLDEAAKQRLAAITERLAVLGTQFCQNVLADEKAYSLVLEGEEDLAGLPDFLLDAAAETAAERGLPGKHVITLSRSSIEPFLQFSTRRDLREQAFRAWTRRGENGGDTDNRAIVAEMVALRAERAKLLGYPSFAHFKLDDTMAKTPEAARDLLREVWEPARRRALAEQGLLEEMVRAEGGNFSIAPWDWRHYAERRRKAEFDLDQADIKPYLELDSIVAAAFDTAGKLFGLTFTERTGLDLYHPDVRAWEVTDRDGRHVGLFLGDYFARSSKRSGAWMSAFRTQQKLAGEVRPIIVNVCNFAKAEPALLSFDDARTLFHEFGHALHGLLSDVTYPLLAGTAVSRDFVEFPSQLYEHWFEQPEVLRRFARHYRTGEPMPETLLKRLLDARTFNQGFSSVEYCSSAIVDLDFHALPSAENLDVEAFERQSLERIGMPEAIVMRHRTPHFGHIFAGEGYSAGYYSYLWSEVLDADGFDAFEEAGDIFAPEVAERLKAFVYSAGNLRDPAQAYTAFRGRMPSPAALLRKRGLDSVAGGET